ncbi:YeiH family protein [Kitasatospora sp. NPDC057542]|uniref:YeiH family protein n=1 Tax=Streptomycetaceae TaxID=2062 RepID=UPI001CCB5DB2|nr:putative sulfate exporter family transporter [Streptomyces sp. LS1784]
MRGDAPGLLLAALGVAAALGVHALVPAVPELTAAVVLGMVAAHLPGLRPVVRGIARPGLSTAGKRLMRLGIVLLGLKLSLDDVLGLGWATVAMVLAVVAATFAGTLWMGRRLGLPGDQPLLVATGYSICGASAIGAVSQAAGSEEEDVAASVALVTLCGTLAIAVLPLLQHPLGLGELEFGRWVGASVHDVGQVVATAQTGGAGALREAVLVKLMRVVLLAPLVAGVAVVVRRNLRAARVAVPVEAAVAAPVTGGAGQVASEANSDSGSDSRSNSGLRPGEKSSEKSVETGSRPPIVPLFVAGFLAMIVLRTTGVLPERVLGLAADTQELLLAAALFGLGSAVHLPTMARTGGRIALLGLGSWVVVAGVSYAGVLVTT